MPTSQSITSGKEGNFWYSLQTMHDLMSSSRSPLFRLFDETKCLWQISKTLSYNVILACSYIKLQDSYLLRALERFGNRSMFYLRGHVMMDNRSVVDLEIWYLKKLFSSGFIYTRTSTLTRSRLFSMCGELLLMTTSGASDSTHLL